MKLTREEIERMKELDECPCDMSLFRALCDMALASLPAEPLAPQPSAAGEPVGAARAELPELKRRIDNLREISADKSVNNFARAICAEAANYCESAERQLAEREGMVSEGCTDVDIAVLRKANVDLAAESERLREGLRFYAHGQHWINELHDDKWDTCSGEPQNWYWRENSEDAAEGIENGGIAQIYLSGQMADWEGEPPLEHPCEPVMKAIAASKGGEAMSHTIGWVGGGDDEVAG